jgi:hypothetical protein
VRRTASFPSFCSSRRRRRRRSFAPPHSHVARVNKINQEAASQPTKRSFFFIASHHIPADDAKGIS